MKKKKVLIPKDRIFIIEPLEVNEYLFGKKKKGVYNAKKRK